MPRGTTADAYRQVRTLFKAGALGAMTDGQLLEIFTTRRGDEAAELAFAALIERHGPMVLGVCRRILRDSHDSADAFQATFLVLARRAGGVRVNDSLGRWLYGVSRRVALQARASSARRSAREEGTSLDLPCPGDHALDRDPDREELLAALDEEIGRLPEKYRAAVLLCDLEGTRHDDAARRLRCPVGTVESRLSRGRQLLRARLVRRGFAPAALAAGAFVAPASAALSPALVESTARLARQFTTGWTPVAGSVAVSCALLTERTLKAMFLHRLKTGTLGLLAAASLVVGVVTLASSATRRPEPDRPDPQPGSTPRESGKAAGRANPAPKLLPVKTGDLLRIDVLEALPGRPLSGVRLVRPDGTISLGFYGDLYVDGLNRYQIKVKLVEHLRKFLTDEVLGLVEMNEQEKWTFVDPVDSNRVVVEDHFYEHGDQERRVQALEAKMDEILAAIRCLSQAPAAQAAAPTPPPAPTAAPALPPPPPPLNIGAPPPSGATAPVLPPAPPPGVNDAPQQLGEPELLPDPPPVPFPAPTRIKLPDTDPFRVPPLAPTLSPIPAANPAVPTPAGGAYEERLRQMERKLDRILERIEKGPAGKHG